MLIPQLTTVTTHRAGWKARGSPADGCALARLQGRGRVARKLRPGRGWGPTPPLRSRPPFSRNAESCIGDEMQRFLRDLPGLLALCALGACSATSVPIHGSDGKPYVYVDCNGAFLSLDDCYEKANEICPSGYRIVTSVAPRANPFGNLIVACSEPGSEASSVPAATPTPAMVEDL